MTMLKSLAALVGYGLFMILVWPLGILFLTLAVLPLVWLFGRGY